MINKQKSDLNKDGKLSGYEKKRGMAIAKAMGEKKMTNKNIKKENPRFRNYKSKGGRVMKKSGGCAQLTGFGKARRPKK